MNLYALIFFTAAAQTSALYSSSDDVVELTASNFRSKVLDSDELWVVEFYAPWCGHCKSLAPEWKKAATQLKGAVSLGVVDISNPKRSKLVKRYNVSESDIPVIMALGNEKRIGRIHDEIRHNGLLSPVALNFDSVKHLELCRYAASSSDLKGVANVGAVDMTVHQSVGGPYGIQGFPTIKIFGYNKNKPKDYNGQRSSSSIVEFAFKELRQMIKDRENGGSSDDSGSSGRGGGSSENHVVELTDANFKELVLDSEEPWLVEFFAPWCGHCKRLEPEWKAAAAAVKEQAGDAVKLGAMDATIHQQYAGQYGVRGYPTIKVFRKGSKHSPEDFQGGRDKSAIVAAAMELYEENIDPPTIDEVVSAQTQEDNCIGKQLCVISFLPHILDTGAKGRNELLDMLAKMGEKFKKKVWGWMWAEAGKQGSLEKSLGIGGSGFPAMAVIVEKKKMYTVLTGPFSEEGVESFLNGISYGRAGRNSHSLKDDKMPEIVDTEPWDGKDGQLPEEEDFDLGDFKWDDEL